MKILLSGRKKETLSAISKKRFSECILQYFFEIFGFVNLENELSEIVFAVNG